MTKLDRLTYSPALPIRMAHHAPGHRGYVLLHHRILNKFDRFFALLCFLLPNRTFLLE